MGWKFDFESEVSELIRDVYFVSSQWGAVQQAVEPLHDVRCTVT